MVGTPRRLARITRLPLPVGVPCVLCLGTRLPTGTHEPRHDQQHDTASGSLPRACSCRPQPTERMG